MRIRWRRRIAALPLCLLMAGMVCGRVGTVAAEATGSRLHLAFPIAVSPAGAALALRPHMRLLSAEAASPDLQAQINGPSEGYPGQDISDAIQLSVTNMGGAPVAAGFLIEIGLLMSPGEGPAMYRALVRLASPYPLAPHETRQYRVAGAVIPENFQWGTNRYGLCARVGPANRLGAADRRNKIACTEILILPQGAEGGVQ